MAERPVFFLSRGRVTSKSYSFEWFPGFSASQKRKSIDSLHRAVLQASPSARPLEVSTKGGEPLGVRLSAFQLRLDGRTLENIFQSSKVFQDGGPYPDLLDVPPRDAKRDPRLRASGPLTAFRFQGADFPLEPKTAFYDYIYLAAASQSLSAEELGGLLAYDCFTDIEFNPARSLNTQARTAALLRLLLEEFGHVPQLSREEFLQYHRERVAPPEGG